MIKRLVLHIGDPKTGTSSIQSAMQQGACRCGDVTILPQRELNAVGLGKALCCAEEAPEACAAQLGRLARWARSSDADIGLVSSEFLAEVQPEVLKRALEAYLPELAAEARVLAYVRPHCARFVSAYGQRVKTGAAGGSPKQLAQRLINNEFLSYLPRFQAWEESFGDHFTLRPFVRSELRGGDIVQDFFDQVLEGRPFELAGSFHVNEALAVEEMAALRFVQKVFQAHELDRSLRHQLGAAISDALGQLAGRYTRRLTLTQRDAQRILAAYAPDAQAMDAHFFDKPVMETAMRKAVAAASPTFPKVKAELYFEAERLEQLRALAAEVSALLKTRPSAWMLDRLSQEGQVDETLATRFERLRNKRHIAKVWALVGALAGLMLPPAHQRQPHELTG